MMMYNSFVDPILNYASGVWGFENFIKPQVLQKRIMRFFLGIHRFAPLAAVKTEMDFQECKYVRWIEMLRLFNRINNMENWRLPK